MVSKRLLSDPGSVVVNLMIALVISGCASMASGPGTETVPKTAAEIEVETREYERAGDEAFGGADLKTALVQYLLALENKTDDPNLFAKVGTVYRQQKNYALAERSFKQALNLDPSHVFSREGMGLVNLARERLSVAQLMLEGVVKSQGNRWQSLSALGVIHDLQAQYDTAQDYYLKALRIVPASAKIMNNLGYSYYLQGKLPQAEQQFKKVVEAYPNYAQSWSNLALVYMQRNEVDRAKLAFEKTVSEHQALNNIGYIELLNNNTENARKTFQAAIKVSPSFYPVAQQNIASLNTRIAPPESDPLTQIRSIDRDGVGNEAVASIKVATAEPVPEKKPLSDRVIVAGTTVEDDATDERVSSATTHSTNTRRAQRNDEHPLLKRENILYVQEKLMSYGFNPGPIDGKLGRKTVRAIREFQRSNNMPVTGRLSRTLMSRL